MPQALQLAASVWVSTQLWPQAVSVGSSHTQALAVQVASLGQVMPQPPQLAASASLGMQVEPQQDFCIEQSLSEAQATSSWQVPPRVQAPLWQLSPLQTGAQTPLPVQLSPSGHELPSQRG